MSVEITPPDKLSEQAWAEGADIDPSHAAHDARVQLEYAMEKNAGRLGCGAKELLDEAVGYLKRLENS